MTRASRQRYPAAPFVPVVADPPGELLVTGPVVGLLHRNGVWHAWLFRATDFCWQAAESLVSLKPYEVAAAVAFLDAAPDRPRARAAAYGWVVWYGAPAPRRAGPGRPRRVSGPSRPRPGGAPLPARLRADPRSLARAWFTDDEMARSLDFLAAEQADDGGWPVRRRRWAPVPTLEVRARVTLEALRTLGAYGRPLG
ncbi:hypothetical protein SVIOM342S_08007 [Streptomyces violaceorubidus]